MEPKEYHAKTVDLAIQKACEDLRVSRENLEIQVISDGYRGIFGLVGSKDARISVASKKTIPETRRELVFNRATSPLLQEEPVSGESPLSEKASQARQVVEDILRKMGLSGSVTVTEDIEAIYLTINEDSEGLITGKDGQTLDALQYIVNKIINRIPEQRKQIILDANEYRKKRIQSLTEFALRMGKKAKNLRRPVTTGPMNPHDRRIVHLALKDDGEVTTKSQGEGPNRKVVIYPAQGTPSRKD